VAGLIDFFYGDHLGRFLIKSNTYRIAHTAIHEQQARMTQTTDINEIVSMISDSEIVRWGIRFCIIASAISFFSALVLLGVCWLMGSRFQLVGMNALSCALTYPYRIYLMAVSAGAIRKWNPVSRCVKIFYITSSLGTTWLYTGLVFNLIHMYLAVTRSPDYNASKMSRLFVILTILFGIGNCVVRIIWLSKNLKRNQVNILNLGLITVLTFLGPLVLLYSAHISRKTLDRANSLPSFTNIGAQSVIGHWMVYRFLLIALTMFIFSSCNLAVLGEEIWNRGFKPIELGTRPRPEDLICRYGAVSWTGTVMLFVYCSGKEISTFLNDRIFATSTVGSTFPESPLRNANKMVNSPG
jgi:hypothetical protein